MSFNRISRRGALIGLLCLTGCGFAPVYGTDAARQGLFDFKTEESVVGYRLRERLESRLGLPAAPQFLLAVTMTTDTSPATITSEGDTTRINIVGEADWALKDISTNETVEQGAVRSFVSYAATGSTVATQAAATDANARLAVALADIITSRLLIMSANTAP